MVIADGALAEREAILSAMDQHPFVRHSLPTRETFRVWRGDGTLGWLLPAATLGPLGGVFGPPAEALELFGALTAQGVFQPGRWVHLPRLASEALDAVPSVTGHEDWDFLWTTTPPPRQPGEERVVRLSEADHPALTALIDESFPTSTARPGNPQVVDWYGIREGDRLIACGADRTRGDVGFLAGLTVAPAFRGRGLGAALTAGMSRALAAHHDTLALGVYPANIGAIRLYRRLGYTAAFPLTSVRCA
ncbi:GNAT family N-acetyltransferase [Micromonospora maris]|uniref:Acetyltransferase n=1 Tax=Micromonospora maris TaxID=1003110 RepID=A0A9X0I9A0_9ACTN|nr:GNAT family N-acetyltransferase [Micromonospora maris]AEB44074.1 gcn5-related n-acetyltransferase [Micromonospora maris AB-18-032]KUJ49298.1 acetyltransferase [Micromonospora maris]